MHVAVVSNLFPTALEPERGVFVASMVDELSLIAEVTVVVPLPFVPPWSRGVSRYTRFSQTPRHMIRKGYEVLKCEYIAIPKLGVLSAVLMRRPLKRILEEINCRHKVDVINAHWVFPEGVASVSVGKQLGIPVVLSARGCDVNYYPSLKGRRSQIVRALRNCSHITTVSNALSTEVANLVNNSCVTVIPNGIDSRLFKPGDQVESRIALGLTPWGRIILFVGTLDRVKGGPALIKLFADVALNHQHKDLSLIVVGDGPLRLQLEALATELKVRERVVFAGRQRHERMPLYFNSADLLLMMSLREGRPNAIIEALACGVPVVAPRLGGIPELVQNGANGFTFQPGNISEAADLVASSLKTSWSRELLAASVADLDWTTCARGYMTVLENVVEETRSRGRS